ncbi:MAG: alcohol dehydrogenase [Acidimicrobiales bacterium]|nr:MAG: alcohol dehydrogenase [Acidimicrobiales bacterium]
MRAAIVTAPGQPVEIREDVEIGEPGPGEVKIRMVASGVCHSDLSVQNGTLPLPMPIVPGHEGAGEVVAVGEGVTRLAVGDHVLTMFHPQCGECYMCRHDQGYQCEKGAATATGGLLDGTTRLSLDGKPLYQMAMCGTFAQEAIIPEISAVKVPRETPLDVAVLISCGVLTGVGAALNTADIREGDTVAVLGCGGVGLNVIQGARIAGAGEIIGIDTFDSKLEMAEQMGATKLVNASKEDPVSRVQQLSGGRGADVAFEVIGLEATINQAVAMTRNGGQTVLVGVPRVDVTLSLPVAFTFLFFNKTIKGSWYGSSNCDRDVPRLLDLHARGELKLEELISRRIDLAEVPEAFRAMEAGEVARSVITSF